MENRIQPGAKRQTALALSLVLLLVTLLALLLMWQRSPLELAQASDPSCALSEEPSATCGMSLGIEPAADQPALDCDDVANPTQCTFAVNQPFILTIIADPAPPELIAGFSAEVLYGTARELAACDNTRDEDGDGVVNDGCLQVGPVGESQCSNDTDDDPLDDGGIPSPRRVNDGCPAVGPPEDALTECNDAVDDDGDTVINDGCPPVNAPERSVPDPAFCRNTVDDDNDGKVNDGCPQVGATAEIDQCDGAADDDGDTVVNDGCPERFDESETGDQCTNNTDDDGFLGLGDGFINDGCPAVGDSEFDQCANAADDDGDGVPNDGCPVFPEPAAGGVTEASACDLSVDDDGDGAPNDGCPAVGSPEVGTFCADAFDDDEDGVVNDGCPLVTGPPGETGGQCANNLDDDSDGAVNDGCPEQGPAGTPETGTDCNNATDDDNDGLVNDGCPQVGQTREANDPDTQDFQCNNDTDDDDNSPDAGNQKDGVINDGCPTDGPAEEGTHCDDAIDNDTDGFINDGCPVETRDPQEAGAECTNALDDDGDGRINDGCPPAGGLTYTRAAFCADEVQVANKGGGAPAFCDSFDTTLLGGAAFSVLSSFSPPLPNLNVTPGSTTTLVKMALICSVEGSHTLTLAAAPDRADGASYSTTSGAQLIVKTVEQLLDLDGDGIPEPHQVADALTVHCGELSPPTPTPTPTRTATPPPPTATPVPPTDIPPTPILTPTATATPPATPGPSPELGWMSSGGSIFDGGRVTHGFTLHCDVTEQPNSLQVNWLGNSFHLENLLAATCSDDPAIAPNPPSADFDTYAGAGTGRYNGVSGATAEWTFTDVGEPGNNDTVEIVITDANGNVVLSASGSLDSGNHQAHGLAALVAAMDSDGDGCTNGAELGTDQKLGGQRNPHNFWDFFDTPDTAGVRDNVIAFGDVLRVVVRLGTSGDPNIDPRSPPGRSGYHPAYDRTSGGPNIWNAGRPDGVISLQDVVLIIAQFGHSCA